MPIALHAAQLNLLDQLVQLGILLNAIAEGDMAALLFRIAPSDDASFHAIAMYAAYDIFDRMAKVYRAYSTSGVFCSDQLEQNKIC